MDFLQIENLTKNFVVFFEKLIDPQSTFRAEARFFFRPVRRLIYEGQKKAGFDLFFCVYKPLHLPASGVRFHGR